ncbi:MAG: endolytic transglycosylase MltG [Patescibacteria group bacterium]|jgi:UPF0755 protein
MNILRLLVRALILAAAIGLVCLVVAVNQINHIFFQTPKAGTPAISFTVSPGGSFSNYATLLKERGIIANALWFRVAAEFAGLTDDVQTGVYSFTPGQSYADILAHLTTSEVTDISITFPEGLTLKQMGELVQTKFKISAEDWSKATGQYSKFETHPFVVRAQKPDDVDLEGYLFPDTYRFFADATADDVVQKLIDTMEEKVDGLDEPTGDAKGMTMHEILTLASIVEREVRKPSEMKNVADIFLKRLSIGMALQADSTVNYVTGGKDPSISLNERDTVSPYNTYKNPGLPPGPISNPGMNALTAVIHPATNGYLYFLTDDLGNVYYAETFEQHIQNKAKYLR